MVYGVLFYLSKEILLQVSDTVNKKSLQDCCKLFLRRYGQY